eukprot:334998-Chlamydomonas_euryale.AAC.13
MSPESQSRQLQGEDPTWASCDGRKPPGMIRLPKSACTQNRNATPAAYPDLGAYLRCGGRTLFSTTWLVNLVGSSGMNFLVRFHSPLHTNPRLPECGEAGVGHVTGLAHMHTDHDTVGAHFFPSAAALSGRKRVSSACLAV